MVRRILPRTIYGAIAVLICVVLSGQSAHAQNERSLHWDRYDVTIDNIVTKSNSFDITESYLLTIDQGPFRFGTASIPLGRTTGIDNVTVSDGGVALSPECDESPGTFCADTSGGNLNVKYMFTSTAQTGEQREIQFKYSVHGALRSYAGGDQLYWTAVPADRPFSVFASKVTVNMPADRPPQVYTSYPNTWKQTVEGNTLTWIGPGDLGSSGSVEVRVQYAHDPAMTVPAWQAAFDRERDYVEKIQPLVNLGLLALGVLFAIGGPTLIFIQYAKHGRDPEVLVVPEYLTEPPSDEPPGVVGSLITEQANMQYILATLIDLARRGFIVIEQTKTSELLGMLSHTDFVFHRTGIDETGLRDFEKLLMRGVFGGSTQATLASLRNSFYTHISGIQSKLYAALVSDGYFTQSPETTRTTWAAAGGAIAVVAGGLTYGAFKYAASISPFIGIPFIGLAITGVAMFFVASYMPAKTAKGAQEAARWKAFRTYLKNIKKYTNVQQATDQFERYMPYAVAFGLNQEWIRQFSPVLTSMPSWYYPTYLGGPWHNGYQRGMHMNNMNAMGDFSHSVSGPGGLNEMSKSMTDGLNAMSTGLTKMLNDASTVMTSKPSSSSGGSGGFSGGGSSGGGSSGGGSRGFG
ncbi:MAG: DUF2207 domain-containing protein [Chloroflexota bacterium]